MLVAGGAAYRELIEAGADIAGWDNDVVSLPREQAVGEVNNLILIVAGSGGDVEAAIARVKARIHARAADYDRAESVLVGQFSPHDPQIEQVRALRDTLNGVLAWNRAGGRFR